MIFFNICVYIFIDITSYTCSRLRTVICVHVYSSVSEFCIMDISLDKPGFGVGTTDAKFIFPIHLDRRDRRPQHLESLLGDRVPNVMAG